MNYQEESLDGEEVTKFAQLGLGPYTMEARAEILTELLKVQKELKHPDDPHYELIRIDELKEIRKVWFKTGEWEDIMPAIFEEIMGHSIDWEIDDRRTV